MIDTKKKEEILNEVKLFLNLSEKEFDNAKESKAVNFLIQAPFIVDSKEPSKIALLHTVTYLGERRARKFFKQYKGQSIEKRLEPLCKFDGGDKELIKEYKQILKYFSLKDHKKDKNIDRDMKKFNPILEGENMEDEIDVLKIEINKKNDELTNLVKKDLTSSVDAFYGFWYN